MGTVSFGKERGVGGPRSFVNNSILPDPITFVPLTNLPLAFTISSNEQTITGIDAAELGRVSFEVFGGILTKNNVDIGSTGTLDLNDVIKLRGNTSSSYATEISVTLEIEGVVFAFFSMTTRTAPDIYPNTIFFTPAVNRLLNAIVISNAQVISGIEAGEAGRCSYYVVNGILNKNNINGGTSGYLELGDSINLTGLASPNYSTETEVLLYINDVLFASFSITTRLPVDNTPDPIVFTPRSGLTINTTTTSNTQTITGVDPGAEGRCTFEVVGGFLIKNGVNVGASGTLVLGDVIALIGASSTIYSTESKIELYINGILFSTFVMTTILALRFYADYCPLVFNTVRCSDAR